MIRAAAVALVLPLAAAASDPLAGRVAGTPQTCIDASVTEGGPTIVDQRTILYRRGGTLWRTEVDACPALRPVVTLIVEVYGTGLCRNDRFRILEPGSTIPSAYCRFGRFVPYTRVRGRSD